MKIFAPVGMATRLVVRVKAVLATGPNPTVNMWWAQTEKPMKAMAAPEKTITGYPKSGLRAKVGRMSDIIPMGGRTMM